MTAVLKNDIYANIVESATDAIITQSLAGIVQTWNPAAEQLFGVTAHEA